MIATYFHFVHFRFFCELITLGTFMARRSSHHSQRQRQWNGMECETRQSTQVES